LERELESYKREAKDLRKQVGSSQLKVQTKQQDDKEMKDRIQAKNQEIDKYLTDIQLLTDRNMHLEEQVKDLISELELATKEAELYVLHCLSSKLILLGDRTLFQKSGHCLKI
jgi:hypothetical protein